MVWIFVTFQSMNPSVKQEMFWANVNAGKFWISVIFQPMNPSVVQQMLPNVFEQNVIAGIFWRSKPQARNALSDCQCRNILNICNFSTHERNASYSICYVPRCRRKMLPNVFERNVKNAGTQMFRSRWKSFWTLTVR